MADPEDPIPSRGAGLRYRWLGGVAVAGLALLVAFVVALAALRPFLPATVTVAVAVESAGLGAVVAAPDVGRGFFVRDAVQQPVGGGTPECRFELPWHVRRVRLRSVGPVRILGVELREGSSVRPVAAHPERPAVYPLGGRGRLLSTVELALAAVAGVLAGSALLLRRVRRRLRWRAQGPAEAREMLAVMALALAAMLVLDTAAHVFDAVVHRIDVPPIWPLSVFDPVLPERGAVLAGCACLLLIAAAVPRILAWRWGTVGAAALGLVTVVVTTAGKGWHAGFVRPTGLPAMYWNDAAGIESAGAFLSGFNDLQEGLGTHARVHPPGAVLVYRGLQGITADAGTASLLLGGLATVVLVLATGGLVRRWHGPRAGTVAAMLLAATPALQVYGIASLDVLVAVAVTVTLLCAGSPRRAVRWIGAPAGVVATGALTFGVLFLGPVLVAYEWGIRRSLVHTAWCVAAAALVLLGLWLGTGFDWLEALATAARLENPRGFMLMADPAGWLFTRLEGLAELVLFCSPVVVGLAGPSLRRAGPAVVAGIATLAAMLLTGAYRTGETGRSAMFVIPLVAAAAAVGLERRGAGDVRVAGVVAAVFAQALVMQLLGDFVW